MTGVFNRCLMASFLVLFSLTQERARKKTVYISLEEKNVDVQILQDDGLISIYSIDGEGLEYNSRKLNRDTVRKSAVPIDKLTTVLIERKKELIWLDSANSAFEKQNGVPHPYSLIRNINSFYDKIYVLKSIDEDHYLRTEVIWVTKIE